MTIGPQGHTRILIFGVIEKDLLKQMYDFTKYLIDNFKNHHNQAHRLPI